jgi:hypothetical protein
LNANPAISTLVTLVIGHWLIIEQWLAIEIERRLATK